MIAVSDFWVSWLSLLNLLLPIQLPSYWFLQAQVYDGKKKKKSHNCRQDVDKNMSSTIPHTLLPTFSLCEAPVLLWLSVVRDQTNNAIRVMEGNTDTREKDISKMYFYLDAICSKAPGPRST